MKKILLIAFIFFTATHISFAQSTRASYYNHSFNGRPTASGEKYWDHLLTAASNVYKLGTKLLVTNTNTGRSVKVTVNDRMAKRYNANRIDLSKSAFGYIAEHISGLVPVQVKVLTAREDREIL